MTLKKAISSIVITLLAMIIFVMNSTSTAKAAETMKVYNQNGKLVGYTHKPQAIKKFYHTVNNSRLKHKVYLLHPIPQNAQLKYHYRLITSKDRKIDLWLYNNQPYLKVRNYPVSIFPVPQASWKLSSKDYQKLQHPQKLLS